MSFVARLSALCSALALLAACGNEPEQPKIGKAVTGGILKRLKKPQAAPSVPTPDNLQASIAQALASSDKRLAVVVVEDRNNFSFMTLIEESSGLLTWGSPDRRTISTNGELIIATRGLGNDMMSSQVASSKSLLQARREGTSQRVHRFLNGVNQEVAASFRCTISEAGAQNVSIGEISTPTTILVERCAGDQATFENTYFVSPSGRIVQSRQWLGPKSGYIFWQNLRF